MVALSQLCYELDHNYFGIGVQKVQELVSSVAEPEFEGRECAIVASRCCSGDVVDKQVKNARLHIAPGPRVRMYVAGYQQEHRVALVKAELALAGGFNITSPGCRPFHFTVGQPALLGVSATPPPVPMEDFVATCKSKARVSLATFASR